MSSHEAPVVTLHAPDGARAAVYRHGAHVTSWIPAGESVDRLFLSARSAFSGNTAIRGGIPVIFPQFAARGPLPKHGFARSAEWLLADASGGRARFTLGDSHATRAIWPHPFAATVEVEIAGAALRVALEVENPGASPMEFTAALHTYLRVRDVATVTVEGLSGARYLDSAANGAEHTDAGPLANMAGEVDRIYPGVTSPLSVIDRAEGMAARVTRVSMTGFRDVVLWNPGVERAAAMADLEANGWRRMLCVEAAAIERPVQLGHGELWRGAQQLVAG